MNILISILSIGIFTSCQSATDRDAKNMNTVQVQKDTCDGPDANINCSFTNMPASVDHIMRINTENETADKLIISGTIFKADGKTPYPGVLIYAYHTDSKGYYSKKGDETGVQKWHGHLYGWCRSDSNGHYEINSIRPARYPDNTIPAHIHAAIKKPGGEEPYHIADFVFKDDTLVDDKYLRSIASMVGGNGIVDLKRSSGGTWTGKRDIILTR